MAAICRAGEITKKIPVIILFILYAQLFME